MSTIEKSLSDMFIKLQTFQTSDYKNVPDISPEDMMEAASTESNPRTAFFNLPENKGKQEKFQKYMQYLHSMEVWDGIEDFRDWLQNAVGWVRCVEFTLVTTEEIKTTLWRAIPVAKRRLADTLKPGSMSFINDTLKEYARRMLDTFQPPRYTEIWKQKYNAHIHKVTEPVECYLLDKMRLFRAS